MHHLIKESGSLSLTLFAHPLRCFVLLAMLLAPSTLAQEATVPDSAAGRQLRWSIDWLASSFDDDDLSHFHPSFLAIVPPDALRAAYNQLSTLFRDPATPTIFSVTTEGEYAIEAIVRDSTSGTTSRLNLAVDPKTETITSFRILPAPEAGKRAESWNDLRDLLDAMPGELSIGVWELLDNEPTPIFEYNPDTSLAIGSTFKLYVLGALAQLIESGQASWDEPLAIQDELKSLPSGEMQNEAAGREFTLQHYATKMISISDNTATDHLFHRVGRERIEHYMASLNAEPSKNLPFLTTQEMFKIKLSGDPKLPALYASANESDRRKMLTDQGEVAQKTAQLALAGLWIAPIEIEHVEWFATARECAKAMAMLNTMATRDGLEPLLDVLGANPGIPLDKNIWKETLFKGGSEPGVLNLTWLTHHADGRVFVVSIGWNDPDALVDTNILIERAFDAFALAAGEPTP